MGKCSHGEMFDKTADEVSKGGINKDSGYILFSPHANLHLKAAALAINHTELFFENIRQEIGDKEFANFLQLEVGTYALVRHDAQESRLLCASCARLRSCCIAQFCTGNS